VLVKSANFLYFFLSNMGTDHGGRQIFRRAKTSRVDVVRVTSIWRGASLQSDNPARDIVGAVRVDFVIILSRHILIGAATSTRVSMPAHRAAPVSESALRSFSKAPDCNLTTCSKPQYKFQRMSPCGLATAKSGCSARDVPSEFLRPRGNVP